MPSTVAVAAGRPRLPSRRRVLGTATRLVSGLAAGAAAACAGRPVPAARTAPDPLPGPALRLPAVNVSRDRIIRTVVGLRPFRPSGFRVERQDLGGGRILVHNYGHGGAGVTLSWGSAWLAVEELIGDAAPPARAAVIGCGAVGLATARLLQRRGVEVTIYTKDLPPNTTSNVACAQWSPYSVSDPRVHTSAFEARFERAARISHRIFQEMVGVRYGVHWLPNYPLSDAPFGGPGQPGRLADLFPGTRDLEPGTHPFPVRHAREYTTMMIEPPVYLGAIIEDFQLAGGRIRIRDFGSLDEVAGLAEREAAPVLGLGGLAGAPHQPLAAEQAVDGGLGQALAGRDLAGLARQADDAVGGQARVALLEADQQLGDVGRQAARPPEVGARLGHQAVESVVVSRINSSAKSQFVSAVEGRIFQVDSLLQEGIEGG